MLRAHKHRRQRERGNERWASGKAWDGNAPVLDLLDGLVQAESFFLRGKSKRETQGWEG